VQLNSLKEFYVGAKLVQQLRNTNKNLKLFYFYPAMCLLLFDKDV